MKEWKQGVLLLKTFPKIAGTEYFPNLFYFGLLQNSHQEHPANCRREKGPPTQTNLTTQLPYKIDEDETSELLTSTA